MGRMNKVQVTIREQSSIKWTRVTSHENGRKLVFPILIKQLLKLRQSFEDWIEIVSWKIVKVDSEFSRVVRDFVTCWLNCLEDVFDDWESVWSRRTTQISNAYTLWSCFNVKILNCFYQNVFHLIWYFFLSKIYNKNYPDAIVKVLIKIMNLSWKFKIDRN